MSSVPPFVFAHQGHSLWNVTLGSVACVGERAEWATHRIANAMRASRENLIRHGVEPLAQWLIHAAKRRSTLTYGQAKRRLETEFGFDTIFSIMMGYPAGAVMDRLLDVEPDCPLVNVLLVRQGDGMPGDGAGSFMARYLDKPRLATPGYRNTYPMRWRAACDEIATDVYAFRDWERVYREAFGHRLPATVPSAGAEHDGIRHARTGEGPKDPGQNNFSVQRTCTSGLKEDWSR